MDNDIYKRVYDRIKDYELTPEETNAIEKAKRQLSRHAVIGGIGLASLSFFVGKRRGMNPLPLGLITGAGMFMGSQIGFGTGAMAGINTIKSLPNPDRLVNLVKEVQTDMLAARGLVIDGPRSPPRPMTETEKREYQQKLNDRQQRKAESNTMDVWQQQQQQQIPTSSTENSTPNYSEGNSNDQTDAWDRIRNSERQQQDIWGDSQSKYQNSAKTAETEWMDRNGSLPSGKPTKNKWGDDMS